MSDVESKYKKIYEDDINPFAAFSRKEKDQRYKELGFRDRITLSSGRFLLGNKCLNHMSNPTYLTLEGNSTLIFCNSRIMHQILEKYARAFAFFYTIGLHILDVSTEPSKVINQVDNVGSRGDKDGEQKR
uniref:CASP C-terminal domain-containing protein n=1 Tax=Cucumis melo TaxID=3656 RepID=A0A9I9E6N7_CUCME